MNIGSKIRNYRHIPCQEMRILCEIVDLMREKKDLETKLENKILKPDNIVKRIDKIIINLVNKRNALKNIRRQ